MLSKQNKLNSFDLKELKKAGKRVHSTLFSITYLPADISKYSINIPKKLYKKAILRNKAKRRTFAVIKDLNNRKKGHFSLFLKVDIEKISYLNLKADLESVLCQK